MNQRFESLQKLLSDRSRSAVIALAVSASLILHILFGWPLILAVFKPRPPAQSNAAIEIVFTDHPTLNAKNSKPRTIERPKARTQNEGTSHTKKTPSPDIMSGGFHARSLQNARAADDGLSVGTTLGESTDDLSAGFPRNPMDAVKDAGHGWSGAVQYGNAMGLEATLESLSFFQALHDRIDHQLVYPDDFSRQRIEGRVRIEAEVNRQGQLVRFISTTSDDRILQAYCFAVLVQLLKAPLPKSTWSSHERVYVAFDFDFYLRIKPANPRTLPNAVEKNRLAFGRENEIDPWLNDKLHEIFTEYIPPIIPIPGGFYVDLVAAYTMVQNAINGTPTERQKREERIGKLHEVLRMALKTMGAPLPVATPAPGSTPES